MDIRRFFSKNLMAQKRVNLNPKNVNLTVMNQYSKRSRGKKCSRRKKCSRGKMCSRGNSQQVMMCKEYVVANLTLGSSHSKASRKKIYKSRLTYKNSWEEKYTRVYCNNPQEGMFCGCVNNGGKLLLLHVVGGLLGA